MKLLKAILLLLILPGSLFAQLSASVKSSFKDGVYKTVKLSKDIILYRYYGGSSGQLSNYLTDVIYTNPDEVHEMLALPPFNTACSLVSYQVPKGTTLYVGTIAGCCWTKNDSTGWYDFSVATSSGDCPHSIYCTGGGTQYYIEDKKVLLLVDKTPTILCD